ncbi:hypothetical protein KIW84_071515 [Lathyrus oleraceus]|uniref:Uncharacterized protein n=1 Tax=Pisum sativum TaxID=3888 RepID=A0A9D4VIH7_PEA|nr:hypothetical protein KIW84_071515 [Pisum sativum]
MHISMNCKEDALSNVLVDIGLSLNVLPKSTLSRLSYHGAPMRYSGVVVKAFDDSRKIVIGEVDLPVKIGLNDCQITFQLKFVKNGKLVDVGGEKALLVSHLSSFTYVDAEEEFRTLFQALPIADEMKKAGAPMSSLKDAHEAIQAGSINKWGRVVEVVENKSRAWLGFQPGSFNANAKAMQPVFRSGGFIHENDQHSAAIIEDSGDEDKACANFVMHGQTCNNWVVVDVPIVIHRSKLVLEPIENNDPTLFPNFDFPVFEAKEESDDEEVYDELSYLLEHEEKSIQSFEEQIELVNLGSEDDVKEVKIRSQLCSEVKKGLIDLIRDYSDVLACPITICLVKTG